MSGFSTTFCHVLILVAFLSALSIAEKKGAEKSINERMIELNQIRSELESKRAELQVIKQQEENLLEYLNALDEELSLGAQLIAKIDRQAAALEKSLAASEIALRENLEEYAARREMMKQRLVWIYKRTRLFSAINTISAPDMLSAMRRFYLLQIMNRYDRQSIVRLQNMSQEIEAGKDSLIQRIISIRKLKESREAESELIAKNRIRRKALLDQLRLKRSVQQQSIKDLLAAQENIEKMLGLADDRKSQQDFVPSVNFNSLKGKLAWPLNGEVIRNYGRLVDNRFNTAVLNPGIDIKAKSGTPVSAVAEGRVSHVSWLRGYGSFVIVDHGSGFYSLYAHLDDIVVEPGQEVESGELLGKVGESGSVSGPFLHFELRQGKEHIDPSLWLK